MKQRSFGNFLAGAVLGGTVAIGGAVWAHSGGDGEGNSGMMDGGMMMGGMMGMHKMMAQCTEMMEQHTQMMKGMHDRDEVGTKPSTPGAES